MNLPLSLRVLTIAWLSQYLFAHATVADTAQFDFNSSPTNAPEFVGSARWRPTGGTYDTGYASITDAMNDQYGVMLLDGPNPGERIASFEIKCDVRIGGGTDFPADGLSVSFASSGDPVVTSRGVEGFSGNVVGETNLPEEGTTTGVSVCLDQWFSGGTDVVGISVRVDNVPVVETQFSLFNGEWWDSRSLQTGPANVPLDGRFNVPGHLFVPLRMRMDADGSLDVEYKGKVLLRNLLTPWRPSTGRFVIAGRTGGANAHHHVDNVSIATNFSSLALNAASGVWRMPDPDQENKPGSFYVAGPVPFGVLCFTVSRPGDYVVSAQQTVDPPSGDHFSYLYGRSFDASTPFRDFLTADQSYFPRSTQLRARLEPGVLYYHVHSYADSEWSAYDVSIIGPGQAVQLPATPASFISSYTRSQSTWSRPAVGEPPTMVDPRTLHYDVVRVRVPVSGMYTLAALADAAYWDTFLLLYQQSFQPQMPLANVLLGNDDYTSDVFSVSGFDAFLEQGRDYYCVTTGYDTDDVGDYVLLAFGKSAATSGAAAQFVPLAGESSSPALFAIPPPVGATSTTSSRISGDGSVIIGNASNGANVLGVYRHRIRATHSNLLYAGEAQGVSDNGLAVLCGHYPSVLWRYQLPLVEVPTRFQTGGLSRDGTTVFGANNDFNGSVRDTWVVGQDPTLLGRSAAYMPDGLVNSEHGTGYVHSLSGQEATSRRSKNLPGYIDRDFGGLIGDLPGGEFRSLSVAGAADGAMVIGQGTSEGGPEGILWVAPDSEYAAGLGPGLRGLGDLPGGVHDSYARAISLDGSYIVGYGHGPAGREAVMWTAQQGSRPLREVLSAAGVQVGGWKLTDATGISHDGTRIVGNGVDPAGTPSAWVAVVALPPVVFQNQDIGLQVGSAFSYGFKASAGATNWSATGLPLGLTIDPGTGRLSGSSSRRGVFDIVLRVTNAGGSTSAPVRLIVGLPRFLTPLANRAVAESPFSLQLAADNATSQIEVGELPDGLEYDQRTQTIAGIPALSGSFEVEIRATNRVGTTTDTLSLEVGPSLFGFVSDTSVVGVAGVHLTHQIRTLHNEAMEFTATGLPPGLAGNASGLITGTPTSAGIFRTSVSARRSDTLTGGHVVVFNILDFSPPEASVADVFGSGLIIESSSDRGGDWDYGSFSGMIRVRNTGNVPSNPGHVSIMAGPPLEVGQDVAPEWSRLSPARYDCSFGGRCNEFPKLPLPSIPAGGVHDVDVYLDSGFGAEIGVSGPSAKREDIYGLVYERVTTRAEPILQDWQRLAGFVNYPTHPPTGSISLARPDLAARGSSTVNLTSVQVLGPDTVNEGSVHQLKWTAAFSDRRGVTQQNGLTVAGSPAGSVNSSGVLQVGVVDADTWISASIVVSYRGRELTGRKNILIRNIRQPQAIEFLPLPDQVLGLSGLDLEGFVRMTPSPLVPRFTVVSGPAILSGSTLIATGPGVVVVRATQDGDSMYSPATPVERSVTIRGDDWGSWRLRHFSTAELANPVISAAGRDPDGDGLVNLLEFAFNLNPRLALSTPSIDTGTGSGLPGIRLDRIEGSPVLSVEFIRRRSATAPGISYHVEWSDLIQGSAEWREEGIEVSVTPIDHTWERVRVRDANPNPPRQRFARCRVVLE